MGYKANLKKKVSFLKVSLDSCGQQNMAATRQKLRRKQ